MIPNIPVENKKFCSQWETSISKEVFSGWNMEAIGEEQVKVTCKKTVLGCESLVISVSAMFKSTGSSMNMAAIQGTNGILEKWPESEILLDAGMDLGAV
ncbi:hypothetical protein SCLCIDRAFT_31528 [Scleroderma citrinum Foug A]|uniref:Uncharacterized protein n=1 Tax=Scleroderma citrinum Foug A TaxID=1036808 RepID=A0A0C3DCT1_9AGAM|nr:hypothetical protein SCLCIDRAFT_31528 [Scleroderma citrinum Foug A]